MIKTVDPKIKLIDSPLTSRQAILAPKRADRGGLTEALERRIEEMNYFDITPVDCEVTKFLGLPYIEKTPCVYRPGKEVGTTREHARINHDGEIIVHPTYIYPGQNGWDNSPWLMRVIDNMRPLADRVDFETGVVYGNNRTKDGLVETMDAKGKDYVVIISPHHIVTAHTIDFGAMAKLEQIFTGRELKDPDIGYVSVFSNNAGLPQKKFLDIPKSGDLEVLLRQLLHSSDGNISPEAKDALTATINRLEGYYKSDGFLSGASQPHPHARVISLPVLPKRVEEGYTRVENDIGNENLFHDYFLKQGLLIEEGRYFSLVADPVPEYNGGLLIIAKERQNIVEMSNDELKELGRMRGLARVMQEILYGGLPSNDYMVQTFGDQRSKYPNTRFSLALVPRGNVHAGLELGTKIVGLFMDPKVLAESMKHLKEKYSTHFSRYVSVA